MPRAKQSKKAPAKVGMISLGCPKNLIDTEVLLGNVAQDHVICGDPEDADVVIVNTCAFIDQSREESLDAIRQVARWKKEGKVRGMIVAGCMAQRYGDEIRKAVPSVDSILAMAEYGRIGEVLSGILDAKGAAEAARAPWRTLVAEDGKVPVVREETGRLRVTPRHYAYLRISEGCSNACTFCAIPNFRGLFRSKPADMILAEARELVASGARELNLVSQDATDYGRDLDGPAKDRGLAWLLEQLVAVPGVRWVRILYAYPGHVSDDMIETMAKLSKPAKGRGIVVPYLDMPIQHIETRVLKRMGRRHTREDTIELLEKLRAKIPGIALRTTVISGFPGETADEHDALVAFVKKFKFEKLGAFPYSHEKNTPAGEKFEDDVPAEEKKRRVDEIMAAQQPIAFAYAKSLIGRELDVVVEGAAAQDHVSGALRTRKGRGVFVARSQYEAPEIDGVVFLDAPLETEPGTFFKAEVTAASGYDAIAKATDELPDVAPARARSSGKASSAKKPRGRLPIVGS